MFPSKKLKYNTLFYVSIVLFIISLLLNDVIITTSYLTLLASSNHSSSISLISNTTTTTRTRTTTITTEFNTHWHNVRYISGLLTLRKPPDGHIENLIRKQCVSQHGGVKDIRESLKDIYCTGPIVSNHSCCYCYDEYPNFMLIDDGGRKWLSHKIHIEQELQQLRQQRTNRANHSSTSMVVVNYWFCMEQRENELSQIPLNVPDNIQLAVITGKFGHNDTFQDEVTTLCDILKGLEIFQSSNNYRTDFHCLFSDPDYVRNDSRFQRHMWYKNNSTDISTRGGGYWFHKAVIVRHLMGQYHDNDLIVYSDVDRLEFFRLGTFHALIDAMTQRNAELLIESLCMKENRYNKEDVLVAFNADQIMRDSKQVAANAFIVRNTIRMRLFFDQLIPCQSDWHMISDEKSFLPDRAHTFHEHRHDQAILSMFVKKFMQNSNKVVVGPPAQIYRRYASFHTYKFKDSVDLNQSTLFVEGEEPYCPFQQFYARLPELNKSYSE